jgi:hypothetical protein
VNGRNFDGLKYTTNTEHAHKPGDESIKSSDQQFRFYAMGMAIGEPHRTAPAP